MLMLVTVMSLPGRLGMVAGQAETFGVPTNCTPRADRLGSAGRRQRRRRLDRADPGGDMPQVLIYHDVDDVQHWLASPKREET